MIDRVIDWTGRAVAWLTFAMIAATCVVVVLRYGFDTSAIMLQESVIYMHGMVFMLGLAYTAQHDGHVRVDVLYGRMSARARAVVNLAGHLVLTAPLCATIFFTSLDYVASSWAVLESSQEVGGIPAVFALKTLIPLAASMLLAQAAVLSVREFRTLRA